MKQIKHFSHSLASLVLSLIAIWLLSALLVAALLGPWVVARIYGVPEWMLLYVVELVAGYLYFEKKKKLS